LAEAGFLAGEGGELADLDGLLGGKTGSEDEAREGGDEGKKGK
jgi:hypothetical protein